MQVPEMTLFLELLSPPFNPQVNDSFVTSNTSNMVIVIASVCFE